eukprot:379000-Rhodomonas_salina.1
MVSELKSLKSMCLRHITSKPRPDQGIEDLRHLTSDPHPQLDPALIRLLPRSRTLPALLLPPVPVSGAERGRDKEICALLGSCKAAYC